MYISTLLSAGVAKEFQEHADFFRLIQSPTDDVTVIFYEKGAEVSRAENIGAGYAEKFVGRTFDKVVVTSVAGGTVRFISRLGNDVRYDTPPNGNVIVTNAQGNIVRHAASIGWAAVTTITPANAGRRYLLVQNTSTAYYMRLRMDGTDPTIAQGLRIPPGGYWESPALYAPTGAVKLIAESGAIDVECLEG